MQIIVLTAALLYILYIQHYTYVIHIDR